MFNRDEWESPEWKVARSPLSQFWEKMKKEVVLLIEDSVYEKFMGMVSLCPQVEVVSETMGGVADLDVDYCMACAIRELKQCDVLHRFYDYAYIMVALNEEVVKGVPFFYTPMAYLSYL